MDGWTFLVKSEWPVLAATGLILLRKEIKSLIARLNPSKVTVGGSTVEFREKLEKAEETLPASSAVQPSIVEPPSSQPEDQIKPAHPRYFTKDALPPSWGDTKTWVFGDEIPDVPPDYLITKCWNEVEAGLLQLADALGIKPTNALVGNSVREIVPKLPLSEADRNLIRNLGQMRGMIVHGGRPDLSLTDALRYRDLAAAFLARMSAFQAAQSGLFPT